MNRCKCGRDFFPENGIQCTDCKQWFCDSCYDTGMGDGCHCHHNERKNIAWIQTSPMHPVAEYKNDEELSVKEILNFLMDKNLPEKMSFSIDGNLYCFRTSIERIQWALGFRQAFNLINNKGEI